MLFGATIFFFASVLAEGSTGSNPAGETALILAAAGISVALAGIVALRPETTVLIVVVLLCVVFVLVELLKAIDEAEVDEIDVLPLTIVAAALHAGAGLCTLRELVARVCCARPRTAGTRASTTTPRRGASHPSMRSDW